MMRRRDFLKYSAGGAAALFVGKTVPSFLQDGAFGQIIPTLGLNFTITDALKNMVTHNDINQAQCYFWIYKDTRNPNPANNLPAECPGPHIFVNQGSTVLIKIKNDLDEPHAFFIRGMFNSGPIAPGATITRVFQATTSGTHLYFDNLNRPVNRVMGLHGAFIVMPRPSQQPGVRTTPYDNPTPQVQALFNDLGARPWFPGLAWEEADPATRTEPFRQYIWLVHQASPNLFAEVGSLPAGRLFPAREFRDAFLRDPFSPVRDNRIPQYFTINGQSGHFSHNTPYINPNNRVGEPIVIRVINAGLWTHSMHLHANHFYLIGVDGAPQANVFSLDTVTLKPMDILEWVIPYTRPPDVPNVRGIGRADDPLVTQGVAPFGPHPVWPPIEELNTLLPDNLNAGAIDLAVQLSPMCYPMHDHSEPTQTAQGGNYNLGVISGLNFTGDRNTPTGVFDFPHQPIVFPPGPEPGVFPTAVQPPWFSDRAVVRPPIDNG